MQATAVGTHLEEGTDRGFTFDKAEFDTVKTSAVKKEKADIGLTRNFHRSKVLVKVDRISTFLPCEQEDTGKLVET